MDRLRALLFDYRRPLAAACAALAVLTALDSLRPATTTDQLTVAAHDLQSGQVLTESDLKTVQAPVELHPEGSLPVDESVGRRVAGPMRAGEPVTDRRVVVPRELGESALFMVRVDDPTSLVGIRVGDVVDVIYTGDDELGPQVLVEGAIVASVPTSQDQPTASVGLEVSSESALKLADASTIGGLNLVVRS